MALSKEPYYPGTTVFQSPGRPLLSPPIATQVPRVDDTSASMSKNWLDTTPVWQAFGKLNP